MPSTNTNRTRFVHTWACVLACATFPLVWVGGLVTTTDAGMAFRDWLTSDGHFMLSYPWLSAVGDKFVEHGHRLLGAAVGFLSIVLVVVTWRCEPRRWVRWMSLAILAGVILQGVLGGLRVVLDERTLALVHGCTGPMFFSLCVAMVVFTSQWWRDAGSQTQNQNTQNRKQTRLLRLAIVCTCLAFAQVVIGAILRHSPRMTGSLAPSLFQTAVYFHLLLALLVVVNGLLLAWRCFQNGMQVRSGMCLVGLIAVQVILGAGTWVVKYGVPLWATTWWEMEFVNTQANFLQSSIITSHVAVGSLVLATALAISLRLARQFGISVPRISFDTSRLAEVAL